MSDVNAVSANMNVVGGGIQNILNNSEDSSYLAADDVDLSDPLLSTAIPNSALGIGSGISNGSVNGIS